MKSIKRAAPFGAMVFILIIIMLLTTIDISSCSTDNNEDLNEITASIIESEHLNETTTQQENVVTYVYDITPEEREMLARIIFLEANTESLDCQKAVASVIINRLHSGYWGNTLYDVVYAKNQFTPASKIPYTTPTSTNYEAVDCVIQNGVTVPQYVLYFRANYHHKWKGYCGYVAYDHTYFGYMQKDVK